METTLCGESQELTDGQVHPQVHHQADVHGEDAGVESAHDPVEQYFACITTCSIDDGECITVCTEELRASH